MKTTKKITLATIKSFIKKNREILYIKKESSFDGMQDMVAYDKEASFKKAIIEDDNLENTAGIKGAWFVGQSRNYFKPYSDDTYTGFEIYNCCGSFILGIENNLKK